MLAELDPKSDNYHTISAPGGEMVIIAAEAGNFRMSKSGPGNQVAERERRPNRGDFSI
jgi:hypothetical protein